MSKPIKIDIFDPDGMRVLSRDQLIPSVTKYVRCMKHLKVQSKGKFYLTGFCLFPFVDDHIQKSVHDVEPSTLQSKMLLLVK